MGDQSKEQFWQVLSDEVRRGLDHWRSGQPYDIDPIEWLDGGRSDSQVAIIARPGPGFDDQVILKFARTSEVNNWQAAVSECPSDFSTQHLVAMTTHSPITSGRDNWWIAVLKIAGGDTSRFRPLVELVPNKGRVFAGACKSIVRSMIEEWNPAPRAHSPGNVSRADCLNEIFDSSRVVPGKPLREWLDSNDMNWRDPLVRRSGWSEQLPNPLAFAAEADRMDDGEQRGVLYGRAHGDLHVRNILLPISPLQLKQYKLIDLGGYSSKSPLARDPMHLLLSISLEWLNSGIIAGSPVSRSLVNLIVRPRASTAEKEYQEVSLAIHNAGYEWASKEGWGKEWTQQSLLFLAGCSLRYASRELLGVNDPNSARGWFFDVAAVAARAYLQEADLWDRYRDGCTTHNLDPPPSSSKSHILSDAAEHLPDNAVSNPESDGDPGAQILHFPGSSERHPDKIAKTRWQNLDKQGQWEDLADALREVTLDDRDWSTLAVKTGPLLEEVDRKRPPHPLHDEEIKNHLGRLQEILNRALSPETSSAEIRSACTRVDLLRGWLLDLLAESER
jgi:hypothetical protein